MELNKIKHTYLINDSVYTHIEYNSLENVFLQTKIVNRLLFVTQNALAYFAFPSINTKRYIHSLGTMHMVSYLFQYSLSNAAKEVQEEVLAGLGEEISKIISENLLDLDLASFGLEGGVLHNFSMSLDSREHYRIYLITMQALRLAGLLHDVGHLPFSHQTEFALRKVVHKLDKKGLDLNESEQKFMENYEKLTNARTKALHEKVGEEMLEKLFLEEVAEINREEGGVNEDYIKLLHIMVRNIYEEKNDGFNYKLLHKYVSGTIDADRLDYLNRDSIASGYLTGPQDTIKLAKASVIVKRGDEFYLSFLNAALYEVETTLVNRFNLYKKVIFSSDIVKYDSLLEVVIVHVIIQNLERNHPSEVIYKNISMLWKFLDKDSKIIESISQLDENWLITILKKEYFRLVNKKDKQSIDIKFVKSFEAILFGRDHFESLWGNLNEFFEYLGYQEEDKKEYYKLANLLKTKPKGVLMDRLGGFIKEVEQECKGTFGVYSLVDFSLGVGDTFSMTDGEKLVRLEDVSTVKERLLRSKLNTVPFFIHLIKSKSFDEKRFKEHFKRFLREEFLK